MLLHDERIMDFKLSKTDGGGPIFFSGVRCVVAALRRLNPWEELAADSGPLVVAVVRLERRGPFAGSVVTLLTAARGSDV
jgi:hypothetical protein